MAAGTATRFITDTLPIDHNGVTVRQSRNGTYMPSVANGYLGTVIYSDTVHVSGVYNGKAYPKKNPIYPVYLKQHTHRARVPSTAAIDFSVSGIQGKTSYALDVQEAVFYKWFRAENLQVEQRIYAHQSRKNLLIVEIAARNTANREFLMSVSLNRGDASDDFQFQTIDSNRTGASAAIAKVNETEEEGSMQVNLATVWSKLEDDGETLTIKRSSEEQSWIYITSIATNLDTKFNPLTKDQLLTEHKAAWKALWDTGRIEIEGNLKMAQAVYSSLYYILSSTRHDWPYGLSPGGIPAAEEYMGHTFWDQDIWMFPPLVLMHPKLARNSLKYRKDSSLTGLETSPGERYGRAQIHITGDIAFAAKQFWRASKDVNWLQEIGYPLVYETAEYWASRVEYDVASDRYVINHVMPPDEYHYPVNNSVYTNVVAKINLLFAKEAATALGRESPQEWSTIAEKLVIPFDSENNFHPEYEGYTLDKEVKQADAILIGYPLMYEMDKQLYEERTDPDGPAMTHSMFAIGWLDIGDKKRAERPFVKNYANIRAVIYGYGGFRLQDSELAFNPTLPPKVTKMSIRLNFLGSCMDFVISERNLTITVVFASPIAPPLEVSTGEGVQNLERFEPVTFSRGRGAVRICAVFLLSVASSVSSSRPPLGTATRLVTKKLPRHYSRSSVVSSRNGNFMPSVGNGFVGTVIYSDTVYISGVFNGPAHPKKNPIYPVYLYQHAHRARVPSTASINFRVRGVAGENLYALDVSEGVFYKWFTAELLEVEQRIYAHRTRKNILVVEITAKNKAGKEFEMDIVPNLGYVSRDIHFQMTESGRGDALAATGMVNQTEERGSVGCKVAIAWTYPDPDHPINISSSSKEQTWYFITSLATSLDTKFNPLSEALNQAKEQLLTEHKAAWKALWDTGRIEIEGNLKMAQAVYSSLYYILSSTRHDWPYGLSPGGIPAAEEYMGHTFWDQDIWMYPPLVLLQPDLARSAMKYRRDRLPAARRIAKQYGYKGAMFPWESSYTGLETSPGEKYGKNQNHITGDIALAAKMLWEATKDQYWLREIGFPLAYQTAEYWASRVKYDIKRDRFVINHVMPPDEYHYPVNNSVYTNIVAKINLLFAKEAADILGKKVPKRWTTIAEKMYIPFDDEHQYHPEFEGYRRGVKVKQADVVLIGYPLMYKMDKQVWSERRWGYGAVNFITGAGGFLQAVLYGFGGIRIKRDGLYFNSTLPYGTVKLAFRINYLASSIDFDVRYRGVTIRLVNTGPISPQLELIADGQVHRLTRDHIISTKTMNDWMEMISTVHCS
ncbi:Protein-glucosylgalactosylhydroxylysine glucosidase [Acropora cervicornis]|uniref:Protein-glucosylgalactosylhydroxylysine glucosidase n=1 Tax=Acropora cervicornis TaxID=6130 RepID=A0AAD9UXM5_ACRCE|nr:Protein-glucosylgalactosylhydroxylysine glucosidase [Acropora cervicornis]